jgi:hypothetical protein
LGRTLANAVKEKRRELILADARFSNEQIRLKKSKTGTATEIPKFLWRPGGPTPFGIWEFWWLSPFFILEPSAAPRRPFGTEFIRDVAIFHEI